MNWDEKLIAENEALGGTADLRMDHAIAGAQWMRRQLRTDEAVERVARALFDELEGIYISDRAFTQIAHIAIDALLGDD